MKNFNKMARKLVRDLGDKPKDMDESGVTALEAARQALRPAWDEELRRRKGSWVGLVTPPDYENRKAKRKKIYGG